MRAYSFHRVTFPLLAIVLLTGCGADNMLPVAPNVLRDGSGRRKLRQLPADEQTPEMKILYVTDRNQIVNTDKTITYGFARTRDVRYGVATVSFKKPVTWDELVDYSGKASTVEKYSMLVSHVEERGRYAPTIERMEPRDGQLVNIDPEGERKEELDAQAVLSKALAKAEQKDVYIFIHGFANSFDDSVLRMAGVWHYLGRRGVAIAYTWPAGHGGALGYLYDRESGEFTIYHLKRTLRIIAGCPDVQRVHIISHSRGTDVATTALRELNESYRGAGKDPQVELKLQTLVLAAPDLDMDVFSQRFGSENLIGIAKQVVIYGSKEDKAIGFAKTIFGGGGRLGSFDPTKAPPELRAKLTKLPGFQFIQAEVSGLSSSHAYAFSNPAALSDMVLLLRDGKIAGAENGRPLKREQGWWYLDNSYFNKPVAK